MFMERYQALIARPDFATIECKTAIDGFMEDALNSRNIRSIVNSIESWHAEAERKTSTFGERSQRALATVRVLRPLIITLNRRGKTPIADQVAEYFDIEEYSHIQRSDPNLRGEPDEEQKKQPSRLKQGVTKDEISPGEMLDRLAALGMSEESRQRVETELRYAHKALWNVPREQQLAELRGMTAVEHLRAVWAEEIKRWGNKVYIRTVRSRDSELIDAVSAYESNRRRRKQDRGALKGLNFIKGFEPRGENPSQPKTSVKSMPHSAPGLT